jgi:hypothetical protein
MLHFVQEHQFCRELEYIEPIPYRHIHLLEKIESACGKQLRQYHTVGAGFVVISWGFRLIVWYETDGAAVYLQSIRFDLRRALGLAPGRFGLRSRAARIQPRLLIVQTYLLVQFGLRHGNQALHYRLEVPERGSSLEWYFFHAFNCTRSALLVAGYDSISKCLKPWYLLH